MALSTPFPGEDQDWQCSCGLLESNKYMLENQVECDVTFTLTGEDQEIVCLPAHKYILISRSPVFFAMLSGPLAEKDQKIRVTDISPDIFKLVLRFVYYEEVALDDEVVFHVLYTAKKYFVTSLVKRCLDFLSCELTPDNVCTYLDSLLLFEEQESLYRSCMDLVRQHSNKVFHSQAFLHVARETLCRILKVECLTLREIDVFRACDRWATGKCSDEGLEVNGANKRQVLGDAVKYVHFPTMSVNEFTKIVVPTGILNTDQENLVFRYLLNPSEDLALGFPFPTLVRGHVECKCGLTYEGFVKHTTSPYSSIFHGMPQRSKWSLSLYTDHTIKLRQIAFFGQFKGTIHVSQNGLRKFEVSCSSHVREIDLEDDVGSLDAGLYTIATEVPFSYLGEYYSKAVGNPQPGVTCDQDKVSVIVKDFTAQCFVTSLSFVPSDEMHFVEDYFQPD